MLHSFSSLLALAFAVTATATSSGGLSPRDVSCTTEDGSKGVCASANSACNGFFVEGLCPGGANTLCCVPSPEDRADGADDGDDDAETLDVPEDGVVPEEESKREAAAAEADDGGSLARRAAKNPGHRIYTTALKWIGTKYVLHGGDCKGPTKGGFDCSGLVLHAVCKVTRKQLPHKAQRQYLSRQGRHIPRARAQRGDTLYWATHGDCRNSIKHVAIVKDARMMINASGRGKKVREQRIWTEAGRLRICPYAIRFW